MKDIKLTHFEYSALWNTSNGESIPRPVMRRLIKAGLIRAGAQGYELTEAGCYFILKHAPRSAWAPPVQQGSSEHPRTRFPRQMIGAVIMLSLPTRL